MNLLIDIAERRWIPDTLVRLGIRRLLEGRRRDIARTAPDGEAALRDLITEMESSPIALDVSKANEQHYEVPASFFELVLGPHLKYSACHWGEGVSSLAEAERAMLELTAERAGIEDGMRVLDLGCGWGSLSIWIASAYPACRIEAVSNSATQAELIRSRCRERGLDNVAVSTVDMNAFAPVGRFDRVVSIEMFEHMRNYRDLLSRIAGWLEPDGRLFVHVFCHRSHPYLFEVDGRNDWMARHFFTGGLMPSQDLLTRFDRDLVVERRWAVDGRHYEKTSHAWLERLDARADEALAILADVYGTAEAPRRLQRWRMFFLACAELFGYEGGGEWFVSHYLLRRR